VEGSFPWLENYPDGVSRHSVSLQWTQEFCSHG